jgi:hypothetical protein
MIFRKDTSAFASFSLTRSERLVSVTRGRERRDAADAMGFVNQDVPVLRGLSRLNNPKIELHTLEKYVSISREAWGAKKAVGVKRKRPKADLRTSSAVKCSSCGVWFGTWKMEKKEPTMKDSTASLLESLLRSERGDRRNTSFVHESIEISASPEEGVRLIRAFVRIKQPELRAAIIKLATQIAEGRALTRSV